MVFAGADSVYGDELWRTDGTTAGTYLIADIAPGAASSSPRGFVEGNGVVYFTLADRYGSAYPGPLWRTDGTAAGTFSLTPPGAVVEASLRVNGEPTPALAVLGSRVVYFGSETANGQGLYVSNGAPGGTSLLARLTAASNFTVVGDKVFFVGTTATQGDELWVSDGTVGGTRLVKELHAGTGGASLSWLTPFNGKLYFSADALGMGGVRIWSSDGSEAGTISIALTFRGRGQPDWLMALNNRLVFRAEIVENDREYWSIDGTAASLTQLSTGTDMFYHAGTWNSGTRLYFGTFTPGVPSRYTGFYVTTGSNTSLVSSTGPVVAFAEVGGRVLMQARTVIGGPAGLYLSDGTPGGATLITAGDVGVESVVHNGKVYFRVATTNAATSGLWVSDGTVAGTHILKPTEPNMRVLDVVDGRVVFSILAGATTTLWATDGTAAGTQEIGRVFTAPERQGVLESSPGAGQGPGYMAMAAVYDHLLFKPPAGGDVAFVASLAQQVESGAITPAGATAALANRADGTTSVATLAYQFFTGKTPSALGMAYLVDPDGPNPNNLNASYYQGFSTENRYINFAVNLGKLGEGAAGFAATYGPLSLAEATARAYAVIFGQPADAAKIDALLSPTFVLNGQTMTRAQYFAYYGQDGANGVGAKAAMVGWLLSEAAKADAGPYANANNAFLADLADGSASYAVDLVGVYGGGP